MGRSIISIMLHNTNDVLTDEVIVDERRGIATHSKAITDEQFSFYYRNYQKWARPDLHEFQQHRWQSLAYVGEKYLGILRNK